MDSRRAAPTLGILAAVAVVGLVAVPYLVVEDAAAVATYYGSGTLTPWATAMMALVAVVVFAAGREDRTDPDTAAGAAIGLGAVGLLVAVVWAVTVPADVPLQLTTDRPLVGPLSTAFVIKNHRWALAAASVLPVVAGVWYARALRLL